jgi:hypothetical protein
MIRFVLTPLHFVYFTTKERFPEFPAAASVSPNLLLFFPSFSLFQYHRPRGISESCPEVDYPVDCGLPLKAVSRCNSRHKTRPHEHARSSCSSGTNSTRNLHVNRRPFECDEKVCLLQNLEFSRSARKASSSGTLCSAATFLAMTEICPGQAGFALNGTGPVGLPVERDLCTDVLACLEREDSDESEV